MLLCIDVGNTHIFAGVFEQDCLTLRFRYPSAQAGSSDQLGIFLRQVLRENNTAHEQIHAISICSVVPQLDYSLRAACKKYFDLTPFCLQAGVKTGLKIKYRNPLEVGADRIASALAATTHFPGSAIIVVDLGSATTLCALSASKEYLGGIILPGMQMSMRALHDQTAKLIPVEIVRPQTVLGRSTTESIQSGLFYAQVHTIKALMQDIQAEYFNHGEYKVIATGGFAGLFDHLSLFDLYEPDLVLHGLRHAYLLNH